jgi:DNA (cytosine-5)-methyltransferase 1
MTNFYNEVDPVAAQWLRNLIDAGHIAPGVVDERSIEDVRPDELVGYTQCHFFAGIGIWSYALRRAGWPDDRPVWTGSCPCQPFSQAGKGDGFADERHLWPSWLHLIGQCRPAAILGEQVASKATEPWIDLVQADLESMGYAFGCVPFPAAGVGAPHIRDRAYWVANNMRDGLQRGESIVTTARGRRSSHQGESSSGGMAHSERGGVCDGGRREVAGPARSLQGKDWQREWVRSDAGEHGAICGMGNPIDTRLEGHAGHGDGEDGLFDIEAGSIAEAGAVGRPGPVNGFWSGADWLGCRDGKFRPVMPGSFPLVDGAPGRVGRLRAYGNGLCAEAAREFIGAVMEIA